MSAIIGTVPPIEVTYPDKGAVVYASLGGVELHCDDKFTLDPIQARNFAALLVRAADEVERMRGRPER
jgi:hypothetical protein